MTGRQAAGMAAVVAIGVAASAGAQSLTSSDVRTVAPIGTTAEEELPLSAEERRSALSHLRGVARCVRAQGVAVPDPVSDETGVHLSWNGPPRPDAEAAIGRCDVALR